MAIALSPDEQKRLMVRPATLVGSPARIAATRAMLWPCAPCGWPQPRITSSTSFLSSCGTLPSTSVMQWAVKSDGSVMLNEPRCDWRAGCGCWRRRRLLSWRFLSSGRSRRGASVPLVRPLRQELEERPQVAEFVVRLRDVGGQRQAAAVDPGDRDAERLGADHVGALGLAAVQQAYRFHASTLEQAAEERSVRLVAPRALGSAHEVEAPAEIGHGEQVVVDVRDHGQAKPPGQPIEHLVDVGKARECQEGVEVETDEAGIAVEAEVTERLDQRRATDLAIGAVGLPVAADVRGFPVLPELQRVDPRRARLAQDGPERLARAAADVHERAVDIERQERRRQLTSPREARRLRSRPPHPCWCRAGTSATSRSPRARYVDASCNTGGSPARRRPPASSWSAPSHRARADACRGSACRPRPG